MAVPEVHSIAQLDWAKVPALQAWVVERSPEIFFERLQTGKRVARGRVGLQQAEVVTSGLVIWQVVAVRHDMLAIVS